MSDLLEGESARTIIALVSIITVCGGPFLVGAWALWLHHRKSERLDEMKREMLAMGMTADDVVRVMNAGTPSRQPATPVAAPPPTQARNPHA